MSREFGTQSRGAIALLLASALFVFGGCESSSPTIPIPPPGFLTAPDVDGYATLSGMGATPEAIVLAYNEDAKEGAIAEVAASGDYSVRVQAAPGDTVVYWFRLGLSDTPLQSAQVPAP